MALPYELRALEGALHVAVAALEADTLDLEHSIGASLDNLDQRVQPLHLAFQCVQYALLVALLVSVCVDANLA